MARKARSDRGKPRPHPPTLKQQRAAKLRELGYSFGEIADALAITKEAAFDRVKRFHANETLAKA